MVAVIREYVHTSAFPAEGWLTAELPADLNGVNSPREATAEIRLQSSHIIVACIGGTFRPSDDGQFRVELAHSGDNPKSDQPFPEGSILASSLVSGLPLEYARGALTGLVGGTRFLRLGSGTLTVDVAAHDLINSSLMAFQMASGLLLWTLFIKPDGARPTNDELRERMSKWHGYDFDPI